MPRTFTCACAQSLTSTDDETLFQMTRQHFDKLHPERPMTNTQLWDLLGQENREQGQGAERGASNIEVKDTPQ